MTLEEQAQFLSVLAAVIYAGPRSANSTPAEAVAAAVSIWDAALAQVTKTPLTGRLPDGKQSV